MWHAVQRPIHLHQSESRHIACKSLKYYIGLIAMTMMDSPCTACSSNHDVTIIVIIFAVLPVKLPVTQNAPRRDTPRISASTAVAFETLICRLISVDYCQPRQLVYCDRWHGLRASAYQYLDTEYWIFIILQYTTNCKWCNITALTP